MDGLKETEEGGVGNAELGSEGTSIVCKLCLGDTAPADVTALQTCRCVYCTQCMGRYVELEISKGLGEPITCPDAACPITGLLSQAEIEKLTSTEMVDKYKRFQFEQEVHLDPARRFCPSPGCQAACRVPDGCSPGSAARVLCAACHHEFCAACGVAWHGGGRPCADHGTATAAGPGGAARGRGRGGSMVGAAAARATRDSSALLGELSEAPIKRCPACGVLIERNEGCAQMMCGKCRHAFCWYCLQSLDGDFLLRHYDRGPCRNKLGHTRASVLWHRTQVVCIFAGLGVLLIAASPFLLLAAPCVLCARCRPRCLRKRRGTDANAPSS
ncbi:putative E3 ubiquitin-protein ligase RNF144A [Lampetra fluviatilis]